MFEDLFRMYAFTWVQAHDLIEEVNKFFITDPFIAAVGKTFFQNWYEVSQARSEELILSGHYLSVVAACDSK